jgi:hypothetical protein
MRCLVCIEIIGARCSSYKHLQLGKFHPEGVNMKHARPVHVIFLSFLLYLLLMATACASPGATPSSSPIEIQPGETIFAATPMAIQPITPQPTPTQGPIQGLSLAAVQLWNNPVAAQTVLTVQPGSPESPFELTFGITTTFVVRNTTNQHFSIVKERMDALATYPGCPPVIEIRNQHYVSKDEIVALQQIGLLPISTGFMNQELFTGCLYNLLVSTYPSDTYIYDKAKATAIAFDEALRRYSYFDYRVQVQEYPQYEISEGEYYSLPYQITSLGGPGGWPFKFIADYVEDSDLPLEAAWDYQAP